MTKALRITSLLLVMLMCIAMLASCGIGSYEKRPEKAGYEVEVADKDDIAEMNEEEDDYKVKAMLVATKGLNSVTIVKLASQKQAKELVEELDDSVFDVLTIERKGAVVFYGTEDAVEAAMGK
jgi:hypothetical protein